MRTCIVFFFLSSCLATWAEEGVLTHYTAENGGFSTFIEVVNRDYQQQGTLTLTPYSGDGSLLGPQPVTLEIQPGARRLLTREELGWNGVPVAHVGISAPDSLRVRGRYVADIPEAMPADVPLSRTPVSHFRFTPAGGAAWFDGIVMVNPQETAINVDAALYDAAGSRLETKRLNLGSRSKYVSLLSGIWESGIPAGGFVAFEADAELHFLVLRGSLSIEAPPVLTAVEGDTFAATSETLTYYNQISRVVHRNCGSCHHQGGIGPFPLLTKDEVSGLRYEIEREVSEGNMPPWLPADSCESLQGSMKMDEAEKEMLLRWIREGALEGEVERAPDLPTFVSGDWLLGEPDYVSVYEEPYVMGPGPDQYRCFPVALNNGSDLELRAIEILPGNAEIVHHVVVFLQVGNAGQVLDDAYPGPGYTCFGGAGVDDLVILGAWAPGMDPLVFPSDVGLTLPANGTIIFQVHYHSTGFPESDQTRIGLFFTEETREKAFQILPLEQDDFLIPAGVVDYPVSAQMRVPDGVHITLLSVAPHMHLLGDSIRAELVYPDGTEQCLIDIPRWDFDWQRFYDFKVPIEVPPGSTIKMRAVYDNSSGNPNNPNSPPRAVSYGEETTDEMALLMFGVTANVDLYDLKTADGFLTTD